MNKTNILNISGKTIRVNFSVNYFFKYFFETTGIDLLGEKAIDIEESNTIKVFEQLSALVYAGNKAQHSLDKQDGALSLEQASDLVYSLTPVDAIILLGECVKIINGDEKNVPPQAAKKGRNKAKVS